MAQIVMILHALVVEPTVISVMIVSAQNAQLMMNVIFVDPSEQKMIQIPRTVSVSQVCSENPSKIYVGHVTRVAKLAKDLTQMIVPAARRTISLAVPLQTPVNVKMDYIQKVVSITVDHAQALVRPVPLIAQIAVHPAMKEPILHHLVNVSAMKEHL